MRICIKPLWHIISKNVYYHNAVATERWLTDWTYLLCNLYKALMKEHTKLNKVLLDSGGSTGSAASLRIIPLHIRHSQTRQWAQHRRAQRLRLKPPAIFAWNDAVTWLGHGSLVRTHARVLRECEGEVVGNVQVALEQEIFQSSPVLNQSTHCGSLVEKWLLDVGHVPWPQRADILHQAEAIHHVLGAGGPNCSIHWAQH